ncbi:MAG TPA: ATP-dependent metallopeptidase FtsH/Yme1/Tma family protein, partial [Gaiellales bacterium]|nr:ATP-dependent metallopeptidase FtsH/Yme1/Tma family protein [Gaiellales bacterium]
MDKRTKLNLVYAGIAILVLLGLQSWWHTARVTEVIPYSEFQSYLDQGKLDQITITDNYIQGHFKEPLNGKTGFVTTRVDPDFAAQLKGKGIQFTGATDSNWLGELISWVAPVLIFFGFWWLIFRRFANKAGMGGLMSVGRSRAKIYVERNTKTSFADVAGVDEAKAELEE